MCLYSELFRIYHIRIGILILFYIEISIDSFPGYCYHNPGCNNRKYHIHLILHPHHHIHHPILHHVHHPILQYILSNLHYEVISSQPVLYRQSKYISTLQQMAEAVMNMEHRNFLVINLLLVLILAVLIYFIYTTVTRSTQTLQSGPTYQLH